MTWFINVDSDEPLNVSAETVAAYLEKREQHRSATLVRDMARGDQEHWQKEQRWRAVERELRERLAHYETPVPRSVDQGPTWTGD